MDVRIIPKLLIVVFLFISLLTFGQKTNNQLLRFDGLYETECEFEEDDDEGTQSYLRFYSDGNVLSVSTDCEGSAADLKDWFSLGNKNISVGKYSIKRHRIQFSTTSITGTVEYRGEVKKHGYIKVKSKSLINGYRGKEKYKFIQLNDMK